MDPDPQHGFLRDVFGVGRIAENAAGEPEHGGQVAAGEQAKCHLVAARDLRHKRFVGLRFAAVIH